MQGGPTSGGDWRPIVVDGKRRGVTGLRLLGLTAPEAEEAGPHLQWICHFWTPHSAESPQLCRRCFACGSTTSTGIVCGISLAGKWGGGLCTRVKALQSTELTL